jgi:hypothetical protein
MLLVFLYSSGIYLTNDKIIQKIPLNLTHLHPCSTSKWHLCGSWALAHSTFFVLYDCYLRKNLQKLIISLTQKAIFKSSFCGFFQGDLHETQVWVDEEGLRVERVVRLRDLCHHLQLQQQVVSVCLH